MHKGMCVPKSVWWRVDRNPEHVLVLSHFGLSLSGVVRLRQCV